MSGDVLPHPPMYFHDVSKDTFTQGSMLLYLNTKAEPSAETSWFFLFRRYTKSEKGYRASVIVTLYIYALHGKEFLTDVSVLQETSWRQIHVTDLSV
jgi:hypothetical protein